MINRNGSSLNMNVKFIGIVLLIHVILFSIPALAANEVTVSRTISEGTVTPGGTFTVNVNLTTNQEISILSLKETLPGGWLVTEVDSGQFIYSSSNVDWTWADTTSNISSGTSDTITYSVKVPASTAVGTYAITGTVSGISSSGGSTVRITVLGDNEVSVQKDDTAPMLDLIGDKDIDENTVLSFNVFAADDDGDTITYSAIGLPPGASFNKNSGAFIWTPGYSAAGTYYVKFIATANGLTDSETIAITVNNINRPPVLNSIGNKAVDENTVLSFTVSASDSDGDEISYSVVGLPPGASFNTNSGVFSWTPSFTASGDYSVVFMASDSVITDSETITITVGNAERAPVLDSIGSKVIDENSLLSFTISATDPDGDSVVYSATGLPSGAGFTSTGTFSWTPGIGVAGTYDVTFTAESKGLTDYETVTITVVGLTVDKSALTDALNAATTKAAGAVAGTENGQYPQSAIDAFNSAIAIAEAVYVNTAATQTVVDQAVAALAEAAATFDASVIIIIDQTPPASVTNLNETGIGPSWINWAWENPSDTDFSHVMIYLNGMYVTDISDPYYNVTGLAEGTTHTISIMTVDTSGNINPALVNDSAMATASTDVTPPASVTNLMETSTGPSWIQWTWTNPNDPDFSYVVIYLNDVFFTCTADNSSNYYNVTGLSEGATYTIGIQTVDSSGNTNPVLVNDSAVALKLPQIYNLSGSEIKKTSISMTWETSNDTSKVQISRDNVSLGDISGSTSYTDSNLTAGTTYNYVLLPYNADGLAGIPASISLTTSSSGSGGSSGGSSSKKSSSSGGGASGSTEDYANLAVKDVDTTYLRKNVNVTYEFTRPGNDIQAISLYSLKNSGKITSTVEVLNNRSKVVNSNPEGLVYKFVNIFVGNSGFSTGDNIKDVRIKFRVNSSWMQKTDVDSGDIRLQRYNGAVWEVLPTTQINNTQSYVVFESHTPGFSPFAITSHKTLQSPADATTEMPQAAGWSEDTDSEPAQIEVADIVETPQPDANKERSNLAWILFIIPIAIVMSVIVWKKRDYIVDAADDALYTLSNVLNRDKE
ncbi:PGF-pre-PGF domain-containing protein [Methanomethylovorans sp.]|uniref:PGF-pre-PGF domain-containing protein n=1 Tax=Methanomethylovorans sp. TaxID=2758717 RepID=UPI00351C2474